MPIFEKSVLTPLMMGLTVLVTLHFNLDPRFTPDPISDLLLFLHGRQSILFCRVIVIHRSGFGPCCIAPKSTRSRTRFPVAVEISWLVI